MLVRVKPGGADRFRQNAGKIQADAWYYEKLVGTVHDFRVTFINNDTQAILAVTYTGHFKPYIADIFDNAAAWLDEMFMDLSDSYPGARDPGIGDWTAKRIVEADTWYASNPTMTVSGTVFVVAAETVTAGPYPLRLERFGRPEAKNILLSDNGVDTANKVVDLRDLYNQEDPFRLGPSYVSAYRARLNANLALFDGLDG